MELCTKLSRQHLNINVLPVILLHHTLFVTHIPYKMLDIQRLQRLINLFCYYYKAPLDFNVADNKLDVTSAFSCLSIHVTDKDYSHIWLYLADGKILSEDYDQDHHSGSHMDYEKKFIECSVENTERLYAWLYRSYEQLLKEEIRESILNEMVQTRFEEMW